MTLVVQCRIFHIGAEMADELCSSGIQETVRRKYAEVSETTAGQFSYLTGRALLPCSIRSLPAKLKKLYSGSDRSYRGVSAIPSL